MDEPPRSLLAPAHAAPDATLRPGAVPVTLVGGGSVRPGEIAAALRLAPRLVAVDGGAEAVREEGLVPDLVLGDLDSVTARTARLWADRLRHLPDQDSTDFEKALAEIAAQKAPFALALGFSGGRLDHTLAAMSALVRNRAVPLVLLAQDDIVFAAPRGGFALDLVAGCRVSLFPMGPSRARSEGLVWPLAGLDFAPGRRIGTSNRATGPVWLEVEGEMLVLLPRETLGVALAALGVTP